MYKIFCENENVRFSKVEAGYVVADLGRNEYFYIDGNRAEIFDAIIRLIDGGGSGVASLSLDDIAMGQVEILESLLSEGLLVARNGKLHVRARRIIWGEKDTFRPWPNGRRHGIKAMHVIVLLISIATAACVRWIDRPSVAVSVVRLARRISRQKANVSDVEIAEVYENFCALRRFFYTARDRCFFDSMVVSIFMGLLGYGPSWVFGVQLAPFKAHCWVKANETLLTDKLSGVVSYTPLFAI